jgi:hypothetical protein
MAQPTTAWLLVTTALMKSLHLLNFYLNVPWNTFKLSTVKVHLPIRLLSAKPFARPPGDLWSLHSSQPEEGREHKEIAILDKLEVCLSWTSTGTVHVHLGSRQDPAETCGGYLIGAETDRRCKSVIVGTWQHRLGTVTKETRQESESIFG